ncbi:MULTISPECIES: hypothetical protein [Acinetobacter]|uniref:Uncharacterized protein n=1 Tax=Acinetobacter variabilis TaxID=70346 RepID=N8VI90_9GAMM|nr:hypothetical protein [Acinetobacter variabilis]NHB65600.1 hypothetical protein [Acinetobacter sp. GFQ9D191M]NHC00357.1 hypothetical protein [Acinetobacter sp. GFQ9D192M]HAB42521.1 hypothetical protein [Acinetobacter sp.]ENU99285.1 hypothetical protein F969_01737 [Acinetobacter variabilis]MCU4629077.1 hypothetical protein [Acinetobacter variabilis]
MKFAVLGLMIVFLAVLFALFYVSFKMLKKVRQEERAENVGKVPERQLHPKLQAELEQKRKQEQAEQNKK